MAVTIFAAIDVGSYEVSMDIYQISPKIGIEKIDEVRSRIELGHDTYTNGKISYESAQRLGEVLGDFSRIMKEYKVTSYRACATSTLQEARNVWIVLEQVYQRTGIRVEILSNSEQRFFGYKSIAAKEADFSKIIQKGTAIIEIGGGNVQISLFDKDTLVTTQNFKMGSLRIRERLLSVEKETIYYEKLVEELIHNDILSFKKLHLKERKVDNIILLGDFFMEKLLVSDYGMGENRTISKAVFMEMYERIVHKSAEQLSVELGITLEYASILVPALIIYRVFADEMGAQNLWVPGTQLNDGIAYDYAQGRRLIRSTHNFENDILACAQNIAKRYELSAICRSDMKEPVHEGIPVVVLDTIGELGRLYSLGDIIFVGGSLVKTGGHNILEPAAHGKPILVGPHMFNFKEIFALLNSRNACEQVKNGKELTAMVLRLCNDRDLAKKMGQNCMDIIKENRGATRRNTQELRLLFEKHQIIP